MSVCRSRGCSVGGCVCCACSVSASNSSGAKAQLGKFIQTSTSQSCITRLCFAASFQESDAKMVAQSVCRSVYPSVCLYVCLSVGLCVGCLYDYLLTWSARCCCCCSDEACSLRLSERSHENVATTGVSTRRKQKLGATNLRAVNCTGGVATRDSRSVQHVVQRARTLLAARSSFHPTVKQFVDTANGGGEFAQFGSIDVVNFVLTQATSAFRQTYFCRCPRRYQN